MFNVINILSKYPKKVRADLQKLHCDTILHRLRDYIPVG